MIRNLTEAEWDSLVAAAAFADTEWEEQEAHDKAYTHRCKAVRRALAKVKQLAP